MTTGISQQFTLDFYINGTEFPVSVIPGHQMWMIQNVKSHLPTLMLKFDDLGNQVNSSSLPLNDGAIVQVAFGDGVGSTPTPVQYRVMGTPRRYGSPSRPGMYQYEVKAILDSMDFLRANPGMAITGTSSQVFKTAASTLRLNLMTNTGTQDSMTWIPGQHSWANFLHSVTRHAYVSTTSMMHMAVDEQRNLHFHDVSQKFASEATVAVIYYGTTPNASSNVKQFMAVRIKGVNRSALANQWAGYSRRTSYIGVTGGTATTYSAVDATSVNAGFDINEPLQRALTDVGKLVFAPADCLNTHVNYVNARHQNFRLTSTYTQNVYVIVPQITGLLPMDMVQLVTADGTNQDSGAMDGLYCVTAINKMLYSGRAMEKIELTGTGPSNKNPSLLGG